MEPINVQKRASLKRTRRSFLLGGSSILTAALLTRAPAYAKNEPVRIGVIGAKSGPVAQSGIGGLRGADYAIRKFNKEGGIAGRPIKEFVEEELSTRETIERARKLYLRDKVDVISGVGSTGTGLSLGPEVEQMRKIWMSWDATTQKGVEETLPNPRYTFKSSDNEVEGLLASLVAVKKFKGKIARVAGLGTDFSYGRNQWTTFKAIMEKYDMGVEVVAELWVEVGTNDLTPFVSKLQQSKPDLIHSSLVFADGPIFMKQAHAAGLTQSSKILLTAGGFYHNELKKTFTPEGVIIGHISMYFDPPNASPLLKHFVADYYDRYKEYPHFESDRAYSTIAAYKAAVEKAYNAKSGRWPTTEEIIDALEEVQVESFGGPFKYRKDHIPDSNLYVGTTTHDSKYEFATVRELEVAHTSEVQKPTGAKFFEWIQKKNFDKFLKSNT